MAFNKCIFTVTFFYCICLHLPEALSQENFKNPFFSESNFFISTYEKKMFLNLEQQQLIPPLHLFLTISGNDPEIKTKNVNQSLSDLYERVSSKNYKNETSQLQKIFSEVHKHYLKKYQRYSSFDRLFTDGSYDCLTGTALYAMVLDHFGFKYTIHETALHSYLVVHSSKADVLFESTDPLAGFVAEVSVIEEMESKYSQEISQDFNSISGLTGYKQSATTIRYFNEQISLSQLAGLQYFNQAVISFNLASYRDAVRYLEKSYTIYPCKRVALLLLNGIQKVLSDPSLSKRELRIYSGKTNYYTRGSQKFFN